ncbi:MAG: hypothetical protein R2881_02505 [Eubacteriales bacterium]
MFSHLFVRYGGHARAAGVTSILRENYESFRECLRNILKKVISRKTSYPSFQYDEAVSLGELSSTRVKELRTLSPYGEGILNPCSVSTGYGSRLLRTIGKDDKHFCASVVQAGIRCCV